MNNHQLYALSPLPLTGSEQLKHPGYQFNASNLPSPPCSLSEQHYRPMVPFHALFQDCNYVLNGQDAAATVAAAEQHMQQQQHLIMMQQQNMSFLFDGTSTGGTTDKNHTELHHSTHPFDAMSREQLIARLVTLEKERHVMLDNQMEEKSVSSEHTEEEEDDPELTRTCLWTDCGKQFNGLQHLITHITDVHVGGGKPTYQCDWQNCPRNNKPFTKRHKMFNHLRTHTGERPFACPKPDCEKKFSRPDSLTTHIKTHSNVRPYVCKIKGCKKAYYHARSLKKHERIHASVLPPPYEEAIASVSTTPPHQGQAPNYSSPIQYTSSQPAYVDAIMHPQPLYMVPTL